MKMLKMYEHSSALYYTYIKLRAHYKVSKEAVENNTYGVEFTEKLKYQLVLTKEVLSELIRAYRYEVRSKFK